eukprot:CAMPEP_0116842064 /NCGR_PEP_ID=MMETSP0418-20121206/11298_1 /TAXON_ID=1158023 /ORGANISM="Astrosyne radiata, Strain 13vi08-1A" /LENGTH=369 /DNA_ID=CAMNT_0004472611 /DNA_START=317 /DNA_END=1424 /DNA_ORIENTATION=-
MNVMISFIFGILVFEEKFHNLFYTACAFLTLCIGLVGMAHYSKPPTTPTTDPYEAHLQERLLVQDAIMTEEDLSRVIPASSPLPASKRKLLLSSSTAEEDVAATSSSSSSSLSIPRAPSSAPVLLLPSQPSSRLDASGHNNDGNMMMMNAGDEEEWSKGRGDFRVVWFSGRIVMTKRQLGILGAFLNGTWGGLNLVPLHFAKQQGFGGAAYLISFACGSMMVNTVLWIGYFFYFLYKRHGDVPQALYSLPDWHLEQLWLPGLLAGILYSLGNFGSILSVTYLGQGVGFSLCQTQILVSGLWGIFYYKEIKGRQIITKWFLSAASLSLAFCGSVMNMSKVLIPHNPPPPLRNHIRQDDNNLIMGANAVNW